MDIAIKQSLTLQHGVLARILHTIWTILTIHHGEPEMTHATPLLRVTAEEVELLIDFGRVKNPSRNLSRLAAIVAVSAATLIASWALVGISV